MLNALGQDLPQCIRLCSSRRQLSLQYNNFLEPLFILFSVGSLEWISDPGVDPIGGRGLDGGDSRGLDGGSEGLRSGDRSISCNGVSRGCDGDCNGLDGGSSGLNGGSRDLSMLKMTEQRSVRS